MHSIVHKTGLFFLAAAVVLFVGCEESITANSAEGTPDISADTDSSASAFISIVSGSQSNPIGVTVDRIGLDFLTDADTTVAGLEVEPNFTVRDDTIEFEYSFSGPATEGEDYVPVSPNPHSISYNPNSTSIDDTTISVSGTAVSQAPLTTEFQRLDVTLESASTVNGTREILVGRGGGDIGVTRSINIVPSIMFSDDSFEPQFNSSNEAQLSLGAAFADEETKTRTFFVWNSSVLPFEGTNVSLSGEDTDEISVVFETFTSDAVPDFFANPIAPGAYAQVIIQFAPTIPEDGEAGPRSATLSIDMSNASRSNTIEVPVVGEAVAP